MPIKISITDLNFGDILYIKVDPYQNEYHVVGAISRPGDQVKVELQRMGGDIREVFLFETSKESDPLKKIEGGDGDVEG